MRYGAAMKVRKPSRLETARSPRAAVLTLANALTLSRFVLAPICAFAIAFERPQWALFCFALAVATDLADGPVARRRGQASKLGALLDHSTDAIFVSAGLFALAQSGETTRLLPALVLISFAQYALDSRVLGGRPLRTSWLGRWNGILYYVLLGVPVTRDGLRLSGPPVAWVEIGAWLLVLSTLASVIDRALAFELSRRARGSRAE